MHTAGIEPTVRLPERRVLSIKLRVQLHLYTITYFWNNCKCLLQFYMESVRIKMFLVEIIEQEEKYGVSL